MRYIRAVQLRTEARNEHIVRVRWSATPEGSLTEDTRGQVAWDIDYENLTYCSCEPITKEGAPVITRTSRHGVRYLATFADGVETNNLLRLPHF